MESEAYILISESLGQFFDLVQVIMLAYIAFLAKKVEHQGEVAEQRTGNSL